MPKRKPKSAATVAFNLTLSGKLARRLDKEFARAQEMAPYAFISRSAFLAHCLGEWVSILDHPERTPSLPSSTRVRTRPAARPAIRSGPETRKRIRAAEGCARSPRP